MAASGGIQPLYGVIIHDKCKYADTLKAYKVVAMDLLKDHPDAADLKHSLKELDAAIAKAKH